MKKLNYYMIASAVGLALSAPSMAAELTDAEFAAAEQRIEAEHESATTACASLSGNESEICIVEADSRNEAAMAELEAGIDPTAETSQANSTATDTSSYGDTRDSDASDTSMYGDTSATDTSDYGDSRASDTSAYGDGDTSDYGDTRASDTSGDSDANETDTLFDFDSAELRTDGRETLDEFVKKSKENSVAKISVVGYTDRLGDDAYNQHLSEKRTEAVKEYLVSEGIDASRIRTEGKGDADSTLSANECQGEQGASVIACLQPDRRVVVSMNQMVGSN